MSSKLHATNTHGHAHVITIRYVSLQNDILTITSVTLKPVIVTPCPRDLEYYLCYVTYPLIHNDMLLTYRWCAFICPCDPQLSPTCLEFPLLSLVWALFSTICLRLLDDTCKLLKYIYHEMLYWNHADIIKIIL